MDTSSSSTSATEASSSSGAGRRVWDLPLRVFHWLIVMSVAGSWLTHEAGTQWFPWHVRLGYVTLVLVAFRLAWGFVGSRHARFGSFLRGPRAVLDYARKLGQRDVRTTPGHNPMGGWWVVAALLLLLVQALTGLFANDEVLSTGPLYGYVSDAVSDRLTALHEENFEWIVALVALHLVAIAFYALYKRIDLVRPMITGRKRAEDVPDGTELDSDRVWLAVVLVAIAAGVLWYVVRNAPEASLGFF
jgi:cytochrome b